MTTTARRPVLMYDDTCAFCRRSIRWFQARDLAHRLEYLPRQSQERAQRFPQVDAPQYQGAMQLILPDGSLRSGAAATAGALRRLAVPGWRGLGWCLERWGIRHVAQIGYRWIASNRHRFRCEDNGCKL